MGTFVWCELVCAKCAVSICGQYVTRPYVPRKALEKEASTMGAVFKGNDVFCSKRCLVDSESGDDGDLP